MLADIHSAAGGPAHSLVGGAAAKRLPYVAGRLRHAVLCSRDVAGFFSVQNVRLHTAVPS